MSDYYIQDKGGDPDKFRTTNASFEVIRDLFQQSKVKDGTFASYLSESAKAAASDSDIDIDELFTKYSKNTSVPSWEFFAEAAEEEIPTYKVETARSGRSRCTVCKKNSAKAAIADSAAAESSTAIVASTAKSSSRAKKSSSSAMVKQTGDTTVIEKDEIRVGSIDQIAGSHGRYVWPAHITYLSIFLSSNINFIVHIPLLVLCPCYGRWHHLSCWRVPKKVQQGLTNPTDEQSSLRDLLLMVS